MIPLLEGSPDAGAIFNEIFAHNMDHSMWPLGISKYVLNMWVGSALLLAMLLGVDKTSAAPRGLLRGVLESLYCFIRDEVVYPTVGAHHGRAFMPFFMTLFMFILVLNLVGMMPLPYIGGAATSNLGLTIVLAFTTLVFSVGGGLKYNGVKGVLGAFVPPGLPVVLVPMLFILEIAGFLIKHCVLAVRLFANMLAGHLVVGGFLGLIFLFDSYAMGLVSVPMALFINFIELLVSFLQAYVFTLIATLVIGATVHPEH